MWSRSKTKSATQVMGGEVMKTHVFEVQVDRGDDGRWAASCPTLPGCAICGKTKEEAFRNIREAVEVYVADLVEAGDAVPGAKETIDAPAVSVLTP